MLWTHTVPLAVPLILFSHLEFGSSFPSQRIHIGDTLLYTFSLWPLDFEGGDNLCIQACSAEQLASPSLSEIQPFSFQGGGKELFSYPGNSWFPQESRIPAKYFSMAKLGGFMKCSRFGLWQWPVLGCELHSYKAEWSSNNILDVCDGGIHMRELVCPECLYISVTGQGSKLQQWKGGSAVRFPWSVCSLDLCQGPVLLWPCSVASQTSRFFRAVKR